MHGVVEACKLTGPNKLVTCDWKVPYSVQHLHKHEQHHWLDLAGLEKFLEVSVQTLLNQRIGQLPDLVDAFPGILQVVPGSPTDFPRAFTGLQKWLLLLYYYY